MPRAIPILIAGLLTGCAVAKSPLPGAAVSADYTVSGGEWNQGGTVSVLVRTFESGGAVAFCGAWTSRGGPAISELYQDDVVAAAVLFVAGQRIDQGLTMLPRTAHRADMTGTPTRCFRTGLPWRPAFAGAPARVRFPRMVFEWDEDGDTSPLIFRERTVPRIIG